MLAILCFESQKPGFLYRIKRKLFSLEPLKEKIECKEITFLKISLPYKKQKLDEEYLEKLFEENTVFVPKEVREVYSLPEGIELELEKLRISTGFDMEEYIESKIEKGLKKAEITVVDEEGLFVEKVNKLLEKFDNIEILTKNTECYLALSEKVFETLGAVIKVKNLFEPIENSYVLDFFDKGSFFKGKNIIFGKQSRATHSLLLTDYRPKLKEIYMKNKPKELTEEEFFYLLKDYGNLKDFLPIKHFTCAINGVRKSVDKAVEAISKNIT